MGLLKKFREYQEAKNRKKIDKAAALIKNPKAIKEDRRAAIEFFGDYEDPAVAVPALLQRFEYSLEHGINDTREKEAAMEATKKHGEEALPYIREHLHNSTRIAWPIKVLNAFGKDDQAVEILKSALDYGDTTFDQAKVDKNYDILCYLQDYKLPGFAQELRRFLEDPDERVRFACVELLCEQDDEEIPGMLESFLYDGNPDNNRIRQSIIDAFRRRGWTVQSRDKFEGGYVGDGIYINDKGQLEARG